MRKLYYFFILCVGLSMVSCHHHDEEEHHHHDAEPITVYTDRYELYAEVSPLIVGEEASILAHFTHLDNFKPLDSASITLTIINGRDCQTVCVEHPEQAGIYHFEFTPEKAGCARLVFALSTGDSVVYPHLHILASHEEEHHHEEGEHHHEEGEHHHEEEHHHAHEAVANSVKFTKEQSWKIDFATEVVKAEEFGSIIKTSAQILSSQGDEREASAKASGIVVFANPNLVEGTSVTAGQRLFSIESSGMADNNMAVKFQEAAANYTASKAEYERKQQLVASQIVSQAEVERARVAYESAKAVYDNLKGNFSRNGATISAPISGFVKSINVRNGAYVEAGQSVITISQNRDLFVRAELQPRYYAQLQNIAGATLVLPDGEKVYSLDELEGSLVSYGKAIDAANPLIPVTFRIRNVANLISGEFVTLYIRSKSDSPVVTLPNSGIVEEMGSYFVFVQITPELFEKRLVQIGSTDGLRTVITSGLSEGERVVSKGATMVRLAQSAGALDPHAGHVHSH